MTRPESLGLGYRSDLARAFDWMFGTKDIYDKCDKMQNGEEEEFQNPVEYRQSTISDIYNSEYEIALGKRLEPIAESLNNDTRPLNQIEEEMYECEVQMKYQTKAEKIAYVLNFTRSKFHTFSYCIFHLPTVLSYCLCVDDCGMQNSLLVK